MTKITPGIYEHYKGKTYRVIGLAHHSETLEELVVYVALYHDQEFGIDALWVRPAKMFTGYVVLKGKKVRRFKFVSDEI